MRRPLYLFLLLLASIASAQERTDTLRESSVSADIRIESISEGLASQITRISQGRMELENRLNYKDLSTLVPNLMVPEYGSKMTSSIYMRGLGSRIDNPVIGMYIDGIPVSSKNSFDQDLFDLRSVEVFRGPQGTLFGKNTIGGLISITTLSPLSYQGTRAEIGAGNGGTFTARVSRYEKISERLGLALGASESHRNGFYWNDGRDERCDASDEASARFKAEYIAKDGGNFLGTVTYDFVKQRGFPYHRPDKPIAYNDYAGYRRNAVAAGLTYTKYLGNFIFENTASYQLLDDRMDMDQDYTTMSYFTLRQSQKENCVVDELTMKPARSAGRWTWISGLSASWRHDAMSAPVTFLKDGIDNLILANANAGISHAFNDAEIRIEEDQFVISSDFTTVNEDLGLFHTSYIDLGPVRLEAGLRLEMEHIGFSYGSESSIHYLFTATMKDWRELVTSMPGKERMTYIEPLPRIAISPKAENWKVYASISEGYKAGGYNTQLFSDILQNRMMNGMMKDLGVYLENASKDYEVADVISYKPERCWNFEVGGSFSRKIGKVHLTADAAIFDIETLDQQLTVFPATGTGRYMTNAGRSRSRGGELTASAIVGNLSLNVSGGLTDSRFIRYDNGRSDFSGNHVPYSPAGTFSASGLYRIPLGGRALRSLNLSLSMDTVGTIWWNEENDEKQDPYSRLNGSVQMKTKWFSVTLWGRNITDTRYHIFWFKSMGNDFLQDGLPMTYGLKLSIDL